MLGMTNFLLPMVSRASSGNNFKNAKNIIDNALRIMLIFLAPMVILMSFYSKEILRLLYGKEYLAGAIPMSVLVYGVGFLTIFYVLSFAMNGAGKTATAMIISTIGVITNAVLNYFLIIRMGILGSAYATSITSFIIMILALYFIKGLTKGDVEYFKSLIKSRKKEEVEEELSGNEPGA